MVSRLEALQRWILKGEAGEGEDTGDSESNFSLNSPLDGSPQVTPAKKKWRMIKYYFPAASWISGYQRSFFLKDVVAGLTVSAMLVPQSLAYASLVGDPAINGLYTAFIPVTVYAFFGTSRQLALGPEALCALLVGQFVEEANAAVPNLPGTAVTQAASIMLITGVLMLVFGILRLGFLNNIMSRGVLSGFITAVVLVICSEQFDTLLGIPTSTQLSQQKLLKIPYVVQHWNEINTVTIGISCGSIAFLFIARFLKSHLPRRIKFLKWVPEYMILVGVGIALGYYGNLSEKGVKLLGFAPPGVPHPLLPSIFVGTTGLSNLFQQAAVLSAVGFFESSAVARRYSMKHRYPSSSNRELVALGLANVVGSFFGCFPAYGSLGRSRVNDASGAQTQLSGLISAMVALLSMLFLTPLFYFLPRAVMASIVFVAVASLLEVHEWVFLWRIRAFGELALILLTFLLTALFDVEDGLLLSIFISLLILLKNSSRPACSVLGEVADRPGEYDVIVANRRAQTNPETLVLRVDDTHLYFANVKKLQEIFDRLEHLGSQKAHPSERSSLLRRRAPELLEVVLDLSRVRQFDGSALYGLVELVTEFHNRDILFAVVGLQADCLKMFRQSGLEKVVGKEFFFANIDAAIQQFKGRDSTQNNTELHDI